MADFQKAWDIIATYEGPWDTKGEEYNKNAENGKGAGHYFYGQKLGTAYGITGHFLHDYVPGYFNNPPTLATMKALGKNEAGEIWKKTVWKWILGEYINDQDIATLLLDWFIKSSVINPKKLPQLFNIVNPYYIIKWTYESAGTRPKGHSQARDGFFAFSPLFVTVKINKEKPEILFNKIKATRAPRYSGDMWRQRAFKYGNILTKTQLEAYESKNGNRKLVASRTTVGADAETSWGTWALVALAFYAFSKN